jgi:hypothetical protein
MQWARQTLESSGWIQHLQEPDWALSSVAPTG